MNSLDYPEGATPLDSDEAEGLRLTHITSLEELNQFEAENIHTGLMWAKRSRQKDIIRATGKTLGGRVAIPL